MTGPFVVCFYRDEATAGYNKAIKSMQDLGIHFWQFFRVLWKEMHLMVACARIGTMLAEAPLMLYPSLNKHLKYKLGASQWAMGALALLVSVVPF